MREDKIAAFYDDPIKQACDAWSSAKAYHFRSVSIDNGIHWGMLRWARFLYWLGLGLIRRISIGLHRPAILPARTVSHG